MNNYDVFLSYSHKDKVVADAICHYFEKDGLKCWIAPRDILPGMKWAKSIAEAIPNCTILLLIFSSHSNASDQVLREVELAVSNGKIIVPVRIEDINPAEGMKYYLATVHWIDILDRKIEDKLIELTETTRVIIRAGKKPDQNIALSAKKAKAKLSRLRILVLLASFLAVGVIFFIYRANIISGIDQIFTKNTWGDFNGTTVTNASVTPAETPNPTATPTARPTETIDPEIDPSTPVEIPDFYLRSAIMQSLELSGQPVDGVIKVSDMRNLIQFYVNSYERFEAERHDVQEKEYTVLTHNNIESLEGLQYAQNLTSLSIEESSVRDISALSQIHSLISISISNSELVDISPMTGNMNLEYVWLGSNQIYDIKPLAALYKIKELGINGNPLDSVSVLLDLPNLRSLSAVDLDCDDIDKILLLNQLELLRIQGSSIDDLTPLLEFDHLKKLSLDRSQYEKNMSIVDTLIERGCQVYW